MIGKARSSKLSISINVIERVSSLWSRLVRKYGYPICMLSRNSHWSPSIPFKLNFAAEWPHHSPKRSCFATTSTSAAKLTSKWSYWRWAAQSAITAYSCSQWTGTCCCVSCCGSTPANCRCNKTTRTALCASMRTPVLSTSKTDLIGCVAWLNLF